MSITSKTFQSRQLFWNSPILLNALDLTSSSLPPALLIGD